MESYQQAKMPPPVPPKYYKLTLKATSSYQKENVFENGHYEPPSIACSGATLIQTNGMRVKIRINPENPVRGSDYRTVLGSTSQLSQPNGNNVKININGTGTENHLDKMLLKSTTCTTCNNKNIINAFECDSGGANDTKSNNKIKYVNVDNNNSTTNAYLCYVPPGQSSPSDHLDSGTCSDVDASTSTPPSSFSLKKNSNSNTAHSLSVHQRSASLNSSGIGGDSDDDRDGEDEENDDNDNDDEDDDKDDYNENENNDEVDEVDINDNDDESCHSINSGEFNTENEQHKLPIISAAILKCSSNGKLMKSRNIVSSSSSYFPPPSRMTYNDRIDSDAQPSEYSIQKLNDMKTDKKEVEQSIDETNTDRFLCFHLNENNFNDVKPGQKVNDDDDSFAGIKSLTEKNTPSATIRSAKGTVRGVKNRVRAGIATFLNNNSTKTWQDKEAGKVVVYTTTMGIVRETYHRCLKVRQILKTHLVKFEEKDVFMSRDLQKEIRERMNTKEIVVPQVFVEGIHIGDAETIDRLNESGELRQILKPYKSADALNTCQVCGGYRLLPCNMCNGSKKSTYRNHFSTELVTLKCMNCDEVGLVKCYAC